MHGPSYVTTQAPCAHPPSSAKQGEVISPYIILGDPAGPFFSSEQTTATLAIAPAAAEAFLEEDIHQKQQKQRQHLPTSSPLLHQIRLTHEGCRPRENTAMASWSAAATSTRLPRSRTLPALRWILPTGQTSTAPNSRWS